MVSERTLRQTLVTPELVSGIVLVSVFVAVADQNDGVLDVFAITVVSVLVFWFTEVFSHTVAEQRRRTSDDSVDLGKSLRIALAKSRGFLFAAILPTVFLVIGLFGVNEGIVAYWAALWVGVASLAVIGWIAFEGRGNRWYWRVGGALATACLGLMAVLLKILVH
ncbi:hypothetical protein N1027_16175 [Herbiconiux sp. CPCC 205763]|uniref:VIT family protein n=1 Tax=Herbiconiux aconitum TaxID=2970913 RepID=A0ABT2GWJ7_9MICO|nr:hypothetical protein [Herbiconiux aconitum]MCS5719670.1 hypothetical protein [Herbiconiux aconitum]